MSTFQNDPRSLAHGQGIEQVFKDQNTKKPTISPGSWYKYTLIKRDTLQIARSPDDAPLPDSAARTVGDSVKKKFFPNQGMVAATDKVAFGTGKGTDIGDYGREDKVRDVLKDDGSNPLSFFSYQMPIAVSEEADSQDQINLLNFLENSDFKGVSSAANFRRVSLYGRGMNEDAELYDRPLINTDFKKYLFAMAGINPDNATHHHKSSLISCFYQIMKIHEILYLNRITHGDMHMGNIKVIIVNDQQNINNKGVVVKTFDFGKAGFKTGADNYTRKDLEYLIKKDTVSGSLEGLRRHVWRAQYNPLRFNWAGKENEGIWHFGKKSKTQEKHYPLHHLFLVLAHLDKRDLNESTVSNFIKRYGVPFLDYLGRARLNPRDARSARFKPDEKAAIEKSFELFSNLTIEYFDTLRRI